MAPKYAVGKAKPRPTPQPAPAWAVHGNARNLRRRSAVGLLNVLAEEVGVKNVPVKSSSSLVEKLARRLEPRCQSGDLLGRLRAAVAKFLDNGGKFSTPVLRDDGTAVATDDADDADGDAPPPLQRHRLFKPGFQLNTKAFMLTFNSESFTESDWPQFRKWVKDKRGELGARRWAACLEVSEHASGSGDAPQRKFFCVDAPMRRNSKSSQWC